MTRCLRERVEPGACGERGAAPAPVGLAAGAASASAAGGVGRPREPPGGVADVWCLHEGRRMISAVTTRRAEQAPSLSVGAEPAERGEDGWRHKARRAWQGTAAGLAAKGSQHSLRSLRRPTTSRRRHHSSLGLGPSTPFCQSWPEQSPKKTESYMSHPELLGGGATIEKRRVTPGHINKMQ